VADRGRQELIMAQIVVVDAGETFTHVKLTGRLDMTGVEQIEAELTKQTVGRRLPAIVDITAVDILASIGIGMLIKVSRLLHSHGLIFGVVATGLSKDTLERLKVDTIFPVVPTFEQAKRTLMLE
jgi:anti-anti-sigma factor